MDVRKETGTRIELDSEEVERAVMYYIERQGVKLPQSARYYFNHDGGVAVCHDE